MPLRFERAGIEFRSQRGAPLAAERFISQETELVGTTDAEVGAEALRQRRLPAEFTDAIRLQHTNDPVGVAANVATLARPVNGASDIGRLLCEIAPPETVAAVCQRTMLRVGLPIETLAELLPSVESDISELAAALRVDVIPSRVYRILAEGMSVHLTSVG